MAENFSLSKYFREQYLKESLEIDGRPGTVTIGGGSSGIRIPTNQGDYIYYVTDDEYDAFINSGGNVQKSMASTFLKSGKAEPYTPIYSPIASLGGGKGYHIDEVKEADRLEVHPDRDKIKTIQAMVAKEREKKDVKSINKSEDTWNAIDVSRKAEKEISNSEWNSRTTKKLDMLKALNKAGKFKKEWDNETLQGWVDQNYSWEKLSRQFKNLKENNLYHNNTLEEGTCGYTLDGEKRNKPAGPDLIKLKEKILKQLKNKI